ncbi:MAG: glycosyltransferase family 4 protein [Candidatus Tectomicrobia bacterium]|nr:glycosyltransferase family 4 protein [Candidatus Tectomicrobia bacterium]
MKIAHLDSHRAWGGGQQQALYLTQFLRSQGHESVVVGPSGGALLGRVRAAGAPFAKLNMRHELDLIAAWRLGAWLRREGVDILHMHEPHAHSIGLLACTVAPGIRKVVSRRVEYRPVRNLLSRYKYTVPDVRYLAVSEAVRKVMLDSGIAEEAVYTVYDGVDLRRIDAVDETSHVFPDGTRVIGTVGHLSAHKGHRYLLRAMRDVYQIERQARLVIVGEGKLRADLEAEAAALGLGDVVCFAGFRHDVLALIRGFEIFAFPSTQEALGTSILDAMALCKPVVATLAGGIPETVQDGITGLLVPTGDPRALAKALLTILQKPECARRFGEAGRRRVEKHFTAERTGSATLRVYRDVCHKGSP